MSLLSKPIRRLRQIIHGIARVAWLVAAVGIFATMAIIVYDVLARYVLNEPSEWVFQSASSGLLAITFLALPYLYAKDAHIAVDLVYDQLPRAVQLVAGWVTRAIAIVLGLVLAWYGFDLVRSASEAGLRTSGAFNFPLSWVSAPMPIGGSLLALVALATPAPIAHQKVEIA